jgi:hypothetical protein
MKWLRTLVIVILALALVAPASGAASAQQGRGKGLSKHDRALLSEAVAQGQETVTLLIAARRGADREVIRLLEGMGAVIRYHEADISYIRAIVPVAVADQVAKLDEVEAVDLAEVIPFVNPLPDVSEEQVNVNPPGADTPAVNPYMPTGDIGAPQFVAQNPTYDGRGVVVGIVDTGVDLLVPELQTAKDLQGNAVPKIIDWQTWTDPLSDNDPTWLNMANIVNASGGAFEYNGVSYVAPQDGEFRFALFNERASAFAGSEMGQDVNRDGNPAGSSGLFGVLWATDTNRVWVDTNQNNDFTDQQAMTDYKVNRDMGEFGVDNPATLVRETIPFVVQTDGQNKFVNIGIVSGAHGSHVAGIIAGKDFFGGEFDGVAPEAQLVSVRACMFASGCTSYALFEGMIYVAKQANVDIINMSIGGLPALNDANNARAVLYNRLIEQYNVQMFLSAGNEGPGVNTVGDPAVSANAISVGAYVTRASWLANYGASATREEGLFPFSSRGPSEAGALKPNIVAPGSAISSVPAWQPGQPVGGTYALPPGYAMFNGTSMAAPQAAGAGALLTSAALQAGAQHQPAQLRKAIMSSARVVPGVLAHEQGAGLLQVGAAWDLLKQNLKLADISSRAPVNTIISQYLAEPNHGLGIYEREGWSAGQSATRPIEFRRNSGGAKAVTYQVGWINNDGTFSSASSIALPARTPVDLNVTIAPQSPGVHSAILTLDDPSMAGIEYMVLNTVIAAEQFSADNNFTVAVTGSADRPDKASFFFYVPTNTPAFKVDLAAVGSSRLRLLRFHPYGIPYDNLNTTGYQTGGVQSRTAANPTPGVWEVTVDTSRSSTVAPGEFTLTASLLGVDIEPPSWTVDNAQVGQAYTQTFTFSNRFGAFTGNAVGSSLASAFRNRPTINAGGPQQVVDINVPTGATQLMVRIGNVSDNAADLDLFLYRCVTGSCVLAGYSAGSTSDEVVTINNPAVGLWKALIDPYAVPAGSTEYDYLDVLASPGFGAVTVSDPPAVHGNNTQWSVSAQATAAAAPESGRFLMGFVRVVSGNAVLGSAEVNLLFP